MTTIFIQQPAEKADTPSIFLRPRLRLRVYRRAPATTPLGLSYWRVGLNQHSRATLATRTMSKIERKIPCRKSQGRRLQIGWSGSRRALNMSVLERLGFEVAEARRDI